MHCFTGCRLRQLYVVRVVNRFDGLDLFAELVSHPVSEGDVLVW